MSYFTKRYHPPGTPPGTLPETLATAERKYSIFLTDYTREHFTETPIENAGDVKPYLESTSTTWIHVQGAPDADTLRRLGDLFGLHPLALEDIINTGQRPKIDLFDGQTFLIVNRPQYQEKRVQVEQVSLFAGMGYVISFHNGDSDPFDSIRNRLRTQAGRVRAHGADYLLYSLLDYIIDEGFPVLESLGDDIEALEEELLLHPTRDTLHQIHVLKRELVYIRRMIWPQREIINSLLRDDLDFIQPDTRPYLRDCYDHTIQIMDLLETYRDMTSGMLDVYLSSVSNRMNEIMRTLTVIATIFIPLTFIVGVYGMNFGARNGGPWAMPELEWEYGYPLLWFIMLVIAIGMVAYFRKRNWF